MPTAAPELDHGMWSNRPVSAWKSEAEYRAANEPRFWSHVEKSSDGCWRWVTGARHPKGYGGITWLGRTVRAHRLSWMLANGEIPDGAHVLHRCDNPACVRPDHLYLGTNQENVNDKMTKGRHHGANQTHCRHGHAFTPENVMTYQNRRHCRRCRTLRSLARSAVRRPPTETVDYPGGAS